MRRLAESSPSGGPWKIVSPVAALLCALLCIAPLFAKGPADEPTQVRRPHRDQDERHRGGSATASKR